MIDRGVILTEVLGEQPVAWPVTFGVAVPIPEPFLGELGAYRERFGDPQAHAIVAHITLLAPFALSSPDELFAAVDHLERSARGLTPFPVVLAGAGTFRPVSPVVFVPLEVGHQQVTEVQAVVRRGPLGLPAQFPFHPHVTVAHDLDEPWLDQAFEAMKPYRAGFEVASMALFVQGLDGIWRQRLEFAFGGQPNAPVGGTGEPGAVLSS